MSPRVVGFILCDFFFNFRITQTEKALPVIINIVNIYYLCDEKINLVFNNQYFNNKNNKFKIILLFLD